ncbi:HAMP domain-containing histidine kinase [Clostridium estertheticum]|uniref:histidine kinase n=1 Tax=Clostridium estertheticum TaxID=238834 RepID=A0AA47EJM6_9CLOT|nr:HAMP domain-containing sensor histidine kinase [Clostridium estertheticum]MBU3156264.1 HAMP domain-containing histidine kinase [Clostridium estertheticum]MBU3200767.1 HAMP domain-containing histidine kinase [Clostridium estertheticum]WAG59838.1 HAMP domain-containing histidine kinase [Clostridium estertheticum]WAG66091.1 HAMP domain-containing histidine kinase [Clostridium estertheticum]
MNRKKLKKIGLYFKSKKMATQLFKNYIIFLIIIIAIFMLTMVTLVVYFSADYVDLPTDKATAEYIIKQNYKDINVTNFIKHKGYVEVLDKNLVIIMENGSKHKVGFKYPQKYYQDMITNNLKDGYFYSSKYGTKKEFILITAMPNSIFDAYTWGFEHKQQLEEVSKRKNNGFTFLTIFPFIIFIFLLSTMVLYSKLTSMMFVKPLKKLLKGVNTVKNGEYSTRVEINSLNEIGQLKDAFNLMAEKIQEEKLLKEKAEHNRKRMILDISHDLKNPLTSILGYSEFLLENNDIEIEDRNKLLKVINNNSRRANDLIQDLFEFSRVESTEYKLDVSNHDIGEFLRELIAGYVPIMEQKGVLYEFSITEDEVEIPFDRKNLDRALSNILLNSIKYNSPGITISIKLLLDNNVASIIIEDNGVGIPKEFQGNIFEPFVRVDTTRNSRNGGTGLGLAISKAIIEKHGGSITLVQDINKGCKFIIKLNKSIYNI